MVYSLWCLRHLTECSVSNTLKKTKKIEKLGQLHSKSMKGSSAQIARVPRHIYVPEKNLLSIFDLETFNPIYTIETEGNILEVFRSRDGDFIGAIDINFLYTVDTQNMLIVQRHPLTNLNEQTKMMILDMDYFDQMREYKLPTFNQDIMMLKMLDFNKITGLRYMPIDHLANCFSSTDNQKSILSFASFYSYAVDKAGGYDYLFGPLNPFTFAIYFSEEAVLQTLLEDYTYPRIVRGFMTPIEYCLQNEENDCLRILCNILITKNKKLHMTRIEFNALLNKEFEFCHHLLSLAPRKIPFDKMNFGENIESDMEIRYSNSFYDFMIENEKKQYEAEHNATPDQVEESRQRIDILYAPFKYEFKVASKESMNFLNNFADSESDEFVLSEWKTVISNKWKTLQYLYAFNAVIFWIYMFFCTYSIIFNLKLDDEGAIIGENIPEIRYCALAFNIIIAILEILQMIAYCSYNPSLYFGDFWNYIDVFALVLGFLFFAGLHEAARAGSAVFIALILMLLIYYRGFSYLRFFDSFTSMIGMINTIVGESVAFFAMLFYAYFVIFFLLIRVDPGDGVLNKLRDAYIFTLFGGVEQDHFEAKYIFFPIVIGTMIVTIILLNVLIAFMSNVYNRMELRQEITSLKEKASMLLDLEVYMSLFKKLVEKAKGKFNDPEFRQEQQKMIFFLKKIEGVTSSGASDNTFAKIRKIETDVTRLNTVVKNILSKNERDFTSLKKKIKGINKFFGYEQSEISHFDAKMQGIMTSMFEEFGASITGKIVTSVEREFSLKKKVIQADQKSKSIFNFAG